MILGITWYWALLIVAFLTYYAYGFVIGFKDNRGVDTNVTLIVALGFGFTWGWVCWGIWSNHRYWQKLRH